MNLVRCWLAVRHGSKVSELVNLGVVEFAPVYDCCFFFLAVRRQLPRGKLMNLRLYESMRSTTVYALLA